jgi:inner membrane protein
MDSVSQAALGAAVGEVVLGNKIGRKASILGAIVGTLPDLDVLLLPFYSSLARISIHRGLSHSIFFAILAAALLAFAFRRFKWTKTITYLRLFIFAYLVWLTHVLLDAFTTYGTQLYLPFSNKRVSWDSVNLVDPLYTVPLLLALALCAFAFKSNPIKKWQSVYVGLGVSSLYLLFTLWNKQQVVQSFETELQSQGIPYNELLTVPVKLANIHWYGVAKSDETLYIGQYNRIAKSNVNFHAFPIRNELLETVDANTADKMKWFAKDFYVVDNQDEKIQFYNLQCDMQGIIETDSFKAPTAFYFEMKVLENGVTELKVGQHQKQRNPMSFMKTLFPMENEL